LLLSVCLVCPSIAYIVNNQEPKGLACPIWKEGFPPQMRLTYQFHGQRSGLEAGGGILRRPSPAAKLLVTSILVVITGRLRVGAGFSAVFSGCVWANETGGRRRKQRSTRPTHLRAHARRAPDERQQRLQNDKAIRTCRHVRCHDVQRPRVAAQVIAAFQLAAAVPASHVLSHPAGSSHRQLCFQMEPGVAVRQKLALLLDGYRRVIGCACVLLVSK